MSTPPFSNGNGSGGASSAAPPHSIEAEQSVLGAVLLSDRVHYAFVIEEGLRPADFYRERHRVIYESMLDLYTESEPIDVLTVTEHLRSRGKLEDAGGSAEIDALTGAVPAVGNLRRYGSIVKEHSLLRRVLNATYEIQASVHGHDAPPREIVERAEKLMLEVGHGDEQKDVRRVGEILHEEIDKWQRLSAEGRSLTGTPSGFTDLDTITGGFQPGNLIVLAARPSMGKCNGGSTLVFDPMTGARRRLDAVVADVEGGEEAFVASVGPDLKVRTSRVSRSWRNGVKPVYRMTTRLGRTVCATSNHPLLTLEGWRELGDLKPGDRIAVPRRLPRVRYEQTMPDHEIVMLAALIADGSLRGGTPTFCFGTDSPVLHEVLDAAAAFGVRLQVPRRGWGEACVSAGRNSGPNPVTELCRRHGIWGKRSEHKFVPDAIFGFDEERIARFLAVLYACDGHVYASERLSQIGYSTISERLARDVQHLLLRLGIVSRIRTLKRDVYEGTGKLAREVLISGRDGLATFVDRVRVCGKTRQLVAVHKGLRDRVVHTNVDTLPVAVWDRVLAAKGDRVWADISAAAGHPRTHNWHVARRGLSRPQLGVLAEAMQDDGLRELSTSDLWWDEVASIEYAGEEETYDIEVPGDHNFVADDIVVHNSALVTNMAENVALHRERPRPVALFSLEMAEAELAQRFIASQASIKGDDLRKGRLKDEAKWKRVLNVAGKYDVAPLFVDDSSDIGILDIRAKARRLHQQTRAEYGGLGLIIVDYLQLMRADSRIESRVQQVGEMSRGLKILARELSVPVVALSQLSRGVESRTDKRPMLSDLRECVTGDTLVVLADGTRTPIRDLVGTQPTVVAMGADDRLVDAVSGKVWPVGRRQVHELRLASGRTLRATAEHRVRASSGWKTVKHLRIGDRVACARHVPEPGSRDRWPGDHAPLRAEVAVTTVDTPLVETRTGVSAALLDSPQLAAMASTDLFWDRVVSVEAAGEEEVFDLTVPGPACWLADGIVSHNSGNIEQDSDLVMFIYRDEYYNKETTDRPGEAELIIAKHRNGGLGEVHLTFQAEYPRFLSLQRVA